MEETVEVNEREEFYSILNYPVEPPLWDPFKVLSQEVKDFHAVDQIARIEKPTPLQFYRDYVSQNKPVIITGAIKWKALSLWTDKYLCEKMKKKKVRIEVTPNGYADAIIGDSFVKPEEQTMTLDDFFPRLYGQADDSSQGIYYLSHQNGNLQEEFLELSEDIEMDIDWATEALDTKPDAVNLWIGREESITTIHKDHYENMYAVLSGEKHFTLLPPSDYPFLYEKEYKEAFYKRDESGKWEIKEADPPQMIPWISVDPDHPDMKRYPLFKNAHPVRCVVKPGEILYLPSMYYHQVSQKSDSTGRVIAVNFWYDMKFSYNWCYFRFLESVAKVRISESQEKKDDVKPKENDEEENKS